MWKRFTANGNCQARATAETRCALIGLIQRHWAILGQTAEAVVGAMSREITDPF